MRLLRRISIILLVPIVGVLALLTGCQSKLIYFPRPYGPDHVATWDAEPGTTVIDYTTAEGKQQAYLLSPTPKPERLWLVTGGNGTLALDWSDWLREHGPGQDAWLLIDIPGYGACQGNPRPATIRRSLKAVVPAAMTSLQWSLPADHGKLRFFGHSLGSAVSLMAAEVYDVRRGVLLTPFTSSMDMTEAMFGVDLGFLVWHRFDNRVRLKDLEKRGGAEVFILHGSDDEAIPVTMSRELAKEFPGIVRYTEIPGGRHNTLQDIAPEKIRAAMDQARK
ncbi:alpha/beta hydrolase [Luteolibacter arcticus]|uniref:Alpha/beta hydrolase n=1 Tax=Luteolibacter arcticus TaxID=1581411 RepID=A0ABT3GCR7_9BACT|nr:alpha/beta hydrolase [Luteolibacter arcticus]MCW1921095.1 alpha/beta hydrolase [Luteolibacter arcticus]